MTIDDSLPARITTSCPEEARNILLHAWSHDLSTLKPILDTREKASIQDPETGETPLHAAVRSCGPAESTEGEGDGTVEEAEALVQELFMFGAIWNDVDSNNETPGCVALRLGRNSLYNSCVDAGVRAELLFALMDGYEELSSGSVEEDDDDVDLDNSEADNGDEVPELIDATRPTTDVPTKYVPPISEEKPVTSNEYLSSDLKYDPKKLLDADENGVMMSWENDIMNRSVAALIPGSAHGKRILNIGFGMGIIDGMFAALKPSKHHIIEAHPAVLNHIAQPDSKFDQVWEKSGPEEGAFKVWNGKWQDVVTELAEGGNLYDAIYFDTFGEDYSQLREFFMEHVPTLMDEGGRFSFFNGLGADRRICYDVYTKVVELHGSDAGLDVEWEEIDVDMSALGEAGKGEWEGVRRRYWTLNKYRLPVCTFMG